MGADAWAVEDADVEASTELERNIFMNTVQFLRSLGRPARSACLLLALIVNSTAALAAETARTFATPEEAVAALTSAVTARDGEALRAIFGPEIDALTNPDRVQATNEFASFAASLSSEKRLVRESDDRRILEMGTNHWPFPVPIVQEAGRWHFDTAAGVDELLNRRIGANELSTLATVRAYVAAQREYASQDRDGDQVLEFAQKIMSSLDKKDGLYWPPDLDGEISPLGPMAADAQEEGYGFKAREKGEAPQPFHGYFFKVLTKQGKSAPGGKYDYVINGNMIGGFALVAWPAAYGDTGIMTFIVNQQGRVYQKDLGPKTASIVKSMKSYDPEKGWAISPD